MEKIKKHYLFLAVASCPALIIIVHLLLGGVSGFPELPFTWQFSLTVGVLSFLAYGICVTVAYVLLKEQKRWIKGQPLSAVVFLLLFCLAVLFFFLSISIAGIVKYPITLTLFLVNLTGLSIFIAYIWYCAERYIEYKKKLQGYSSEMPPAFTMLVILACFHIGISAILLISSALDDTRLISSNTYFFLYASILGFYLAILRGLKAMREWARFGIALFSCIRLVLLVGLAVYTGHAESFALFAPLDIFTVAFARTLSARTSTKGRRNFLSAVL